MATGFFRYNPIFLSAAKKESKVPSPSNLSFPDIKKSDFSGRIHFCGTRGDLILPKEVWFVACCYFLKEKYLRMFLTIFIKHQGNRYNGALLPNRPYLSARTS
jgi:hypothetical protein